MFVTLCRCCGSTDWPYIIHETAAEGTLGWPPWRRAESCKAQPNCQGSGIYYFVIHTLAKAVSLKMWCAVDYFSACGDTSLLTTGLGIPRSQDHWFEPSTWDVSYHHLETSQAARDITTWVIWAHYTTIEECRLYSSISHTQHSGHGCVIGKFNPQYSRDTCWPYSFYAMTWPYSLNSQLLSHSHSACHQNCMPFWQQKQHHLRSTSGGVICSHWLTRLDGDKGCTCWRECHCIGHQVILGQQSPGSCMRFNSKSNRKRIVVSCIMICCICSSVYVCVNCAA